MYKSLLKLINLIVLAFEISIGLIYVMILSGILAMMIPIEVGLTNSIKCVKLLVRPKK